MARPPRKVTSRDVAARAGVSPMTVSRALRTPERVSVATRERVESAARELAWVPDLVAGALSSKRSGHVAVVAPSLRHTGFLRTLDGLSAGLRARGYSMLIGDSYYSADAQLELLRVILGRRPEALVLIASMHSPDVRRMLAGAGVPIVETWDAPEEPLDMVVGFSQEDAGHAMATALVEQGYRRIGFLAGPPETDPYGELRRRGHVRALAERGLPTDMLVAAGERPMEIEDGAAGVVALRTRWPDADALVCATDMTALGALNECRRRGWRVPGELGIAGHGNFDFSASLVPSLTTVRVPGYRIGETAAALIAARIEADGGGEPPPSTGTEPIALDPRQNLGFQVLHRESTRGGPAPRTP